MNLQKLCSLVQFSRQLRAQDFAARLRPLRSVIPSDEIAFDVETQLVEDVRGGTKIPFQLFSYKRSFFSLFKWYVVSRNFVLHYKMKLWLVLALSFLQSIRITDSKCKVSRSTE